MSTSPITRSAGPLSVAAAVLVVLSQMVRLGVGLTLGSQAPSTTTHTLTYGLALLSMYVLLLALTALYTRESPSLGRLGLIGYLFAFLGTLMVAGDWWFEAFVVPMIAADAPEVLARPPGGSLLVGALATVGPYTIGWVLLGIAALRAGVFARPAVILMISAAIVGGPLALSAPYQIPLAVAVGWIGVRLKSACSGGPQRSTAFEPVAVRRSE